MNKDKKFSASDIISSISSSRQNDYEGDQKLGRTDASKNNFFNYKKIKKIPIIELDPSTCKPWTYHDRDPAWLTIKNCSDLIHSIKKNGQLEPGLVRVLKDSEEYTYEIIYGVRRWYACKEIPNQQFLAKITDISDKEAMILMHSENSDSKDISEFERAISFSEYLKSGAFSSQKELSELLGVSKGYVSKMVKASSIFDYHWLKSLFKTKMDIQLKKAYSLAIILENDTTRNKVKNLANTLQNSQEILSTNSILLKLLSSVKKHEKQFSPNDKVISYYIGENGSLNFCVSNIVKNKHSDQVISQFKKTLREYMRRKI